MPQLTDLPPSSDGGEWPLPSREGSLSFDQGVDLTMPLVLVMGADEHPDLIYMIESSFLPMPKCAPDLPLADDDTVAVRELMETCEASAAVAFHVREFTLESPTSSESGVAGVDYVLSADVQSLHRDGAEWMPAGTIEFRGTAADRSAALTAIAFSMPGNDRVARDCFCGNHNVLALGPRYRL